MRLKILLNSDSTIKLPKHYNRILQGFIYSLFEPIFRRFLHSEGFRYEKRRFKLFCFSRLNGKFKINSDNFEFQPPVNFLISSPKIEILQNLAEGMLKKQEFYLDKNKVFIEEIKVLKRPEFKEKRIKIKMLSPLTVYSTFKNSNKKRTYYYSPQESEFSQLLKENLKKKYKLVFGEEKDFFFKITPFKLDFKKDKKIIIYKGTVIKAWMGSYILESEPKILELSYYTGLGTKNSQGFGMWDLL